MIGRTISHYKILERLGKGGMGEVWKAEDTQLRRTVALKFLSSEAIGDEGIHARLIREAQASASLDHPNICAVHGIHEENGETFIAMAFIDGPSLADKIKERPLPLDEALNIAIQIAEGLQEAHEKGIVHRDVKPHNVMLTAKGQVKIMDFGLASLSGRSKLTKTGTTLGTPAYMSPEQLEGREVDRRADIWALGCVLYEMLTQRTPFDAEYEQAIAYGILNEEPEPVTAQRAGLAPEVDRIIRKALAKDRTERYQNTEDFSADLRVFQRQLASGASSPQRSTKKPAPVGQTTGSRRLAVSLVSVLLATGAWLYWGREKDEGSSVARWSTPQRITSDSGLTFQPAISSDGSLIAYSSDRADQGDLNIWVQHVGGGEPVQVTHDPADDLRPHFSPDGSQIAFQSERAGGGVYVTSALGGPDRLIAREGHRPRFSPDGRWIAYFVGARAASAMFGSVAAGGSIYIAPSGGGSPRELASGVKSARYPVWSSDGRKLLVATNKTTWRGHEWRILTVDGQDLGPTEAMDTIQEFFLIPDTAAQGRFPYPEAWDSLGYVYFALLDGDSTDLWRMKVGVESGRVEGGPELVLGGTGFDANPATSGAGPLVFSSLTLNADLWSLDLDANRGAPASDKPDRLTTSVGSDSDPVFSPDRLRIAFTSERSGEPETWLFDLSDNTERLFSKIGSGRKAFSNTGGRLAVGSMRNGLSVLGQDGVSEHELPALFPWSWSSDDRHIFGNRIEDDGPVTYVLNTESSELSRLFPLDEAETFQTFLSPDGNWLAWNTTDAIWIAPYRGAWPISETGRIRITEEGPFADKPRWSPDGNLLYYTSDRDGFRCIYAQPLDPTSKKPSREFRDIYHSHQSSVSIANLGGTGYEITVSEDRIVFAMLELTGNIWMMHPVVEK